MSINPIPALQQAWQDVKHEFADVPDEHKPRKVKIAQESADALDALRRSVKAIKHERTRLKNRAQ